MKASLLGKLENLVERRRELDAMLAAPDVIADQNRFRTLTKEYAEIRPLVDCFWRYQETEKAIESAEELMAEDDPELRALASEEVTALRNELNALDFELQKLLIPKDPDGEANIFLEIRAGTGGDEAALFAGTLMRMYLRYARSTWLVDRNHEFP